MQPGFALRSTPGSMSSVHFTRQRRTMERGFGRSPGPKEYQPRLNGAPLSSRDRSNDAQCPGGVATTRWSRTILETYEQLVRRVRVHARDVPRLSYAISAIRLGNTCARRATG